MLLRKLGTDHQAIGQKAEEGSRKVQAREGGNF